MRSRLPASLISNYVVTPFDAATPRSRQRKPVALNSGGPVLCEVCGREFRRLGALNVHMNIHTGNRPYVCAYPGCSRSFTAASSLSVHLRTHSNRLQFRCHAPNCNATFKHKLSLRNHQQIKHGLHMNSGPVQASPVNIDKEGEFANVKQEAMTVAAAQRQMETVPFENGSFKRFRCGTCEAYFTQRQTLNRHVRTVHLNDKPFVCIECGAAFGTRYMLSRHGRVHQHQADSKQSHRSFNKNEAVSAKPNHRKTTKPQRRRGVESSPTNAAYAMREVTDEAVENERASYLAIQKTEAMYETDMDMHMEKHLQVPVDADKICTSEWNENATMSATRTEDDMYNDYDDFGVEVDSDEEVQVFDCHS